MPTVQLEHSNLFYTAPAKRVHDTALLLIHGAGGSHLTWPVELRRLAGADVFALDLPGHGRSSPDGRISVDEYVDVVAAFIDALRIKKLVIMGHSMGGAIAISVALRRHPSLAGLILIGTGARLRVTDQILDLVLADYEQAVRIISGFAWAAAAPHALVEAGRELLRQQDPAVVHGDYTACNDFDVMHRLAEITFPTLVISGSMDQLTPVKYGSYLADAIPGASHHIVDGGGHMMALERGQEVAKIVTGYIHTLDDFAAQR